MSRFAFLFISAILFSGNTVSYAQSKGINRDKYRIHIARTDKAINIDGILDEEPWKTAERTGKFQRVTPTDTGYASAQTEVMLTYDETNFYIGIICYDPTPGKRPVESLRRDYSFMRNDNFMLFLDTYNDQTNGFAFGVSAAGAQTEGLQYDGTKVLYSWDIKWRSAVKSYDDRWVTEFSIPFRSIRYFEGDNEWGINFGRLDLKTNEKSAWAPMPRQFPHCSLPFTGTLVWDKPMSKAGLRFSLIPYVTAKTTRDNQAGENAKWNGNAGFDAKMILSTSMNLDFTVNPD
ncbi:MAG TPA: carbohydrate binding family 9 domain-containing protein, partial [Bacteroidales bacterium]|nr:carbohydrate binding family 9 domain-containing protein [Bacteroidales bacterium]